MREEGRLEWGFLREEMLRVKTRGNREYGSSEELKVVQPGLSRLRRDVEVGEDPLMGAAWARLVSQSPGQDFKSNGKPERF